MSEHRELILRCDCGTEHVDIDLYFTKDLVDLRLADNERGDFDEGYLTIQQWLAGNPRWRNRIKTAWDVLRGREHCLTSVILKPADHDRIAEFFAKHGDANT